MPRIRRRSHTRAGVRVREHSMRIPRKSFIARIKKGKLGGKRVRIIPSEERTFSIRQISSGRVIGRIGKEGLRKKVTIIRVIE